MPSSTRTRPSLAAALLAIALAPLCAGQATAAADDLVRLRVAQVDDAYRPGGTARRDDTYRPDDASRNGEEYPRETDRPDDAYRPEADTGGAVPDDDGAYRPRGGGNGTVYRPAPPRGSGGYGEPYAPPREGSGPSDEEASGRYTDEAAPHGSYSQNEILGAGHRFFGSVSQGLAGVVEYAFGKAGRPNGYILGEDAGGALIAGLRYGEGILHTKDAGHHKVYWQGPSVGYDFGAEGSKTMVLVYNLRDPSQIYHRFAGVEGSAYLVGGVSIQFQQHGDVVLAPIRSGVGLRLGANLGYLKYTRSPTWNPF
jgi:hypothetical protein